MVEERLGGFSLRSTLKNVFGLSGEAIDNVIRVIQDKGEAGTMKIHLSKLSGDARRRMSLAVSAAVDSQNNKDSESRNEKPKEDPKEKPNEKPNEKPKEDTKESKLAPSFKAFLIDMAMADDEQERSVTVKMNDEDINRIKDPIKRREARMQLRRNKNPSARRRTKREQIKKLRQEVKDDK